MEKYIFILRIILPAILAYIVFGMIYMLSSSDKQPNPQEINTKDIPHVTESELDSIDAQFELNNISYEDN